MYAANFWRFAPQSADIECALIVPPGDLKIEIRSMFEDKVLPSRGDGLKEFHIRLLLAKGATAIAVSATSVADACDHAHHLLCTVDAFTHAEIWQNARKVATLEREQYLS